MSLRGIGDRARDANPQRRTSGLAELQRLHISWHPAGRVVSGDAPAVPDLLRTVRIDELVVGADEASADQPGSVGTPRPNGPGGVDGKETPRNARHNLWRARVAVGVAGQRARLCVRAVHTEHVRVVRRVDARGCWDEPGSPRVEPSDAETRANRRAAAGTGRGRVPS